MWAIEASPGPKVAYRGGWYHFTTDYTTTAASLIWNSLPLHVTSAPSLQTFKKRLMPFSFSRGFWSQIIVFCN